MKVGNYQIVWKFIKEGRLSTTTIKNLEGEIISHGSAVCSIKDNFCKATGRKVSLTKALNIKNPNTGVSLNLFTKKEKKQIWESYRTMTKTPRW